MNKFNPTFDPTHSPELENLATFRYQGMTLEQLLISLSLKQDQLLKEVTAMHDELIDLKEKKADKTVFTSYDLRLSNLEMTLERVEKNYYADKRGLKVLLWFLGVIGPIAIILFQYYLERT